MPTKSPFDDESSSSDGQPARKRVKKLALPGLKKSATKKSGTMPAAEKKTLTAEKKRPDA